MNATRRLLSQQRQPLIKFLGKRSTPRNLDHTPHVHPASPTEALPESFSTSFASYRQKALQHGPLNQTLRNSSFGPSIGYIGSHSGASLGPVKPTHGEAFDRSELPTRFNRIQWTEAEIEAIETGGASLYN